VVRVSVKPELLHHKPVVFVMRAQPAFTVSHSASYALTVCAGIAENESDFKR
jgi:hypothetical protein